MPATMSTISPARELSVSRIQNTMNEGQKMSSPTSRSALAMTIGLVVTVTGCAAGGGDVPASEEVPVAFKPKVGVIVSDPANSAR
jgi:hypothetical protein